MLSCFQPWADLNFRVEPATPELTSAQSLETAGVGQLIRNGMVFRKGFRWASDSLRCLPKSGGFVGYSHFDLGVVKKIKLQVLQSAAV